MDFKVPEWLNKTSIKIALEHGKEYTITVEDMEIDMPIAKGNNYACDIFGAQVKYRKSKDADKICSTSLIIKCPKKGEMFEVMVSSGLLNKEPKMYNEFAPKLKLILCKNNENFETKDGDLLARSYFTTEEFVVILKNLKLKGYKMTNRLDQLDYKHCVLALKALAKFHAGSVIIHEKEPDFIEKLGEDFILYGPSKEMFSNFSITSFKLFANTIKMYPDLAKYSDWFDKNADCFWEKVTHALTRDENEFNVLNHGDFWSSNMLFKYNDNNVPVEIKLIDLQMCRYSSPVLDLIYFMEGSVQYKVKEESFDDLINIYLKELNEVLERHGNSKRLEKSEFDKAWLKRAYFRLNSALTILPFVVADPDTTELLDLENTTKEDFNNVETNPLKAYYKSDNFIKLVTKSLQEFENIGLIKII